jgi:hypothetical protein
MKYNKMTKRRYSWRAWPVRAKRECEFQARRGAVPIGLRSNDLRSNSGAL